MKSDESQRPQSLADVLNPPQPRDPLWDLMESLRPGPQPLPGTGEVPADIDVMEHRWAIRAYTLIEWIGGLLTGGMVLAFFIFGIVLYLAVLIGGIGFVAMFVAHMLKKR